MTEAPCGRAESSARALAFGLSARLPEAPGGPSTVGNRPEAFPPGLSSEPAPLRPAVFTNGRSPAESCEPTPSGPSPAVVELAAEPGAVTEIATDAAGSLTTSAVLPVAVSWTDFTEVAVEATAICAWSWRTADDASTAPRAHDAVPSWLPQPKLNFGVWPDGAAVSLTVAAETFPPVVQTLTTQEADWPRGMLVCRRSTLTHKLTAAAVASVRVKLRVSAVADPALSVADPAPAAEVVEVADVVPAVLLADVAGLPEGVVPELGGSDGEPEPGAVPEGSGVGEGLLGDGAGEGDPEPGEPEPDEPEPDESEGDAEPDGLGEAVLGVGELLGLLALGVGVGVFTCSHCWAVPDDASVRAATSVGELGAPTSDPVIQNPVADATRAPPAARLTAGRTCAKRMEALPVLFVASTERVLSPDLAASGVSRPTSCCTPTIGHQAHCRALPVSLPSRTHLSTQQALTCSSLRKTTFATYLRRSAATTRFPGHREFSARPGTGRVPDR